MSASQQGYLSEWSIEVEFFVAQARTTTSPRQRGNGRWICPAGVPKPYETCARYCADLICDHGFRQRDTDGGIEYQDKAAAQDFLHNKPTSGRRRMPASMYHWMFSPALMARQNPSTPKEYDWVGIKMRCPLRSVKQVLPKSEEPQPPRVTEDEGSGTKIKRTGMFCRADSASSSSSEDDPDTPAPGFETPLEIESFLALLRAGIKMHVNSSCQMRIFFCHQPNGMELIQAKRMLTICWMLEQDLLLKLRPGVRDPDMDEYLPITTSSVAAKHPTYLPNGYINESPQRERILLQKSWPKSDSEMLDMTQNLPSKFRDSCLQERIHLLWGATNFDELSQMIQSPDGETTVAINASEVDVQPFIEMRYSAWHPQAESMRFWLQLLGQMYCFAMGADAFEFGTKVYEIDELLLQVKKINPGDRWKPLLTLMELDNTITYHWDELKKNERNGCLSPENLDKQGILDMVEGVRLI